MTEIQINGWRIYFGQLFLDQYLQLMAAVEKDRSNDPQGFESRRAAKLFAATRRLIFEDIPMDPSDPRFRHGNTLGEDYRHWFRAKFFQQYRIFFRFTEKQRIIVYAWVNDEDTKRAYDSKSDAYRVFRKMLGRGRPPDDWPTLLREAKKATHDWQGDL